MFLRNPFCVIYEEKYKKNTMSLQVNITSQEDPETLSAKSRA